MMNSMLLSIASGLFSLAQLPINPSSWIAVASLAVLVVIAVSALVYILSGIIISANARGWARLQVYQALLSIFLLIIFAFFSFLFFLNPQGAFGGLGLVPNDPTAPNCLAATTIHTLATCDLSIFNTASFQLANYIYWASYVGGALPGVDAKITPIPEQQGLSIDFEIEGLVPVSAEDILSILYDTLIFMVLLNQIQLIILSGSLLFLFLFVTLGIVLRTVGLTRRFGGSLIALGLGLGLVYPLITAITYGFINNNANLSCLNSITCSLGTFFQAIFYLLFTFFATQSPIPLGTPLSGLLVQLGYLIAGFTFIPYLNFTIVDAFIADFSTAIGERMDFTSLLINVI